MPLAGVEHLSIIVCKLEIQIFWSRVMEAVQVMFTNLLLIFIRLSLHNAYSYIESPALSLDDNRSYGYKLANFYYCYNVT